MPWKMEDNGTELLLKSLFGKSSNRIIKFYFILNDKSLRIQLVGLLLNLGLLLPLLVLGISAFPEYSRRNKMLKRQFPLRIAESEAINYQKIGSLSNFMTYNLLLLLYQFCYLHIGKQL